MGQMSVGPVVFPLAKQEGVVPSYAKIMRMLEKETIAEGPLQKAPCLDLHGSSQVT
jgi:hypothetical protein